MTPEGRFKERARRDLKTIPRLWFFKTQQVGLRGIPDFIICINGRFIGIELKASAKETADPLQEYRLTKIREAGGLGFVAHPGNWPVIFAEIKKIALAALATSATR